MRALGVDWGTRRFGIAVSDSAGTVATPLEVLDARDLQGARRAIAALVTEWEIEVVVVGLPVSLDGTEGPSAAKARQEAEILARLLPVPVEMFDERMTTVAAERGLQELSMTGRARREVVDKVAAAVMLQGWLEARA